MVFSCMNCGARYRIDDKRIEGKTLKFVCKKCSAVHLIRDPSLGEPISLVEDSTQYHVGTSIPGHDEVKSQSSSNIARKYTTMTSQVPAIPKEEPIKGEELWFAIKRGRQIGPFTLSQLKEHIFSGYLHERSFVWRPTMSAWSRINQVPELSFILEEYKDKTQITSVPTPMKGDSDSASFLQAQVEPTSYPQETTIDQLYSQISVPTIDIRKAKEVPPDDIVSKPSFTQISVAPEPSTSLYSQSTPHKEEQFVPQEISPQRTESSSWRYAPSADESGAREFSVMMHIERLSRKSLWSSLWVIVVIAVVTIGLGSGLYWAISSDVMKEWIFPKTEEPPPQEIEEKPKETPKQEQKPVVVDSKPTEVTKQKIHKPKTEQQTDDSAQPNSKQVKIDPTVKAEVQKYASLLEMGALNREEVKVDVKPKTITDMPKATPLTKDGMDVFLAKKGRKFADCKARMTTQGLGPVKVILSFTIQPTGRVTNILVEQIGGVRDEVLEGCIRNIVKEWAFPAQEGEPITYKTTLVL